MLGTSRIIVFVATTNAAKATEFYHGTLGLSLVDDNPAAIVFDSNGRMLRIQKVEEFDPAAIGATCSARMAIATAIDARSAARRTEPNIFIDRAFPAQQTAGNRPMRHGSEQSWATMTSCCSAKPTAIHVAYPACERTQ
jgi:catechol 2,3-dioxygenase-like lactoylglutathione lyase family enzyme